MPKRADNSSVTTVTIQQTESWVVVVLFQALHVFLTPNTSNTSYTPNTSNTLYQNFYQP